MRPKRTRQARKNNAPDRGANSRQFSPGAKKDAERLLFIDWLALPAAERVPRTQRELAQKLGVEPATLSDWKRSPELWQEVRHRVDERVKEHHADVLSALVKEAKQGDVQAMKLYLQYVQGWTEKQRHETEQRESGTINFRDISEEELDEIIAKTSA